MNLTTTAEAPRTRRAQNARLRQMTGRLEEDLARLEATLDQALAVACQHIPVPSPADPAANYIAVLPRMWFL